MDGANAGLAGITAGPDGNIYFTESSSDRIGRLDLTTFVITESAAMGGGSDPRGITAGPDGALWFAEGTDDKIGRITTDLLSIDEFDVSGNNMREITAGPDGNLWFTKRSSPGAIGRITTAGIEAGNFATTAGQPTGITTGPDGNIWFAASENPGAIGRITTSGMVTLFTTGLTTNAAPLAIVAGVDGNLYFTENANPGRLGQITTAGAISEFTTGLTTGSGPWGIASGADGNIWFTENTGNRVGRLNFAPGAVTDPATQITASSATLAGTVKPRSQATTYRFDWGPTAAYGSSTAPVSAGSGEAAQSVTGAISGLAPLTTYHFRVSATNAAGTTPGADRTFTTAAAPPGATTAGASSIGETGALLNAVVNPQGLATTYHFDVGPTDAYGDRLPVADAVVGGGNAPVALQQPLSSLASGTTYHFRVVATNLAGTTYGSDQSFTTVAPAPFALPVTLPHYRRAGAASRDAPRPRQVGDPRRDVRRDPRAAPRIRDLPSALGGLDGARRDDRRRHGRHPQADERQELERQAADRELLGRGLLLPSDPRASRPLPCSRSRHRSPARSRGCTRLPRRAKQRARQLWGKDNNGRFVTRGRAAVATVRGTAWFTRDTCEGTLVSVTRGSVAVRDLVRKVTVIVRAGHKYLARLR